MEDIRIVIHTSRGDLPAVLFPSKAPVTVANFLNLAQRKYFDGLTFHRVVPGFVIQGGDPQGTGSGGPGYRFQNEVDPSLSHTTEGVLAMANAGPDTNGSQFYITLGALHPQHIKSLDGNYSIFGKLTSGLDIANQVKVGDKIQSISVLDSSGPIFEAEKDQLKKWNKVLDRNFGDRLAPPA
jgi:peptidyl-prolyl cis-trans isomerase B (cyclophilin B)